MKRIFTMLCVFIILIVCCSCAVTDQDKSNSNKTSQQQTEEQRQEMLLKDAETAAGTFIKAYFNARYNDSNLLSCLDFKQQVFEFNKSYPDGNSGICYDGDSVIWDEENFESTQKCLEAVEEKFNSMSLQEHEILDAKIFNPEDFDSVCEQREIPEANLFADSKLQFDRFAIVDYGIVMQVEDTTPQGQQIKTYEGTVSVWLLYIDECWKVYSPTIMGLFCGYVYFR